MMQGRSRVPQLRPNVAKFKKKKKKPLSPKNKKLSKLKNQQLFSDPVASGVTGQTAVPKFGETDGQIQRVTTY